MAEYQEVMKQFKRMCWYYQRELKCPMSCPMDGVNMSQCWKIAVEEPLVTEKTVMTWAKEHPEPVYPSVAEYLEQFGVIIRRDGTLEADFFKANEPMSETLAKKLGVKPKEG